MKSKLPTKEMQMIKKPLDDLSLKKELEELLSEPIASVLNREKNTFDQATKPFGTSLVLFGAGGLGKKTLKGLRTVGIEPRVFADNNSELWGKYVDGILVLTPEEAAQKFGQQATFVITIWKSGATDTMAERKKQLLDLNCVNIVSFGSLFWKYPEIFLPHYAFDLPHKVYQQADDVRVVFELWEDESSRREYMAQLRWRMLLDFDCLPSPVAHEIYFPHDLVTLLQNEVFIDCGAYDGDSIRSFQKQGSLFAKLISFEPDEANFQKLQNYISSVPQDRNKNIVLYKAAVGAQKGKVFFEATGTEASKVGSGSKEVDCVTLDETLYEYNPTYIKMDIEGSEPNALIGARNIIEQYTPMLAICAYHRQDHLWQVPLLIYNMSDKYCFFLRPHLLEVWDLVCYAVPKHRLISG